MPPAGRFIRENAFVVAAVSLPLLVVIFFLVATSLPRWLVAPPAYDLLLRSSRTYNPSGPRLAVEFQVRDGHVEAIVRPAPEGMYTPLPTLWVWDHTSMAARQVPIEFPERGSESGSPLTIRVTALDGRRVLAQAQAPDGYELRTHSYSGSGLIGDLFGMRRYDYGLSLVRQGRVIPVSLPPATEHESSVFFIGWIAQADR
jgi:hypothetical protein